MARQDDTKKKNNRRRGGQRAVEEFLRSPTIKAGLLRPGKAAIFSPGT